MKVKRIVSADLLDVQVLYSVCELIHNMCNITVVWCITGEFGPTSFQPQPAPLTLQCCKYFERSLLYQNYTVFVFTKKDPLYIFFIEYLYSNLHDFWQKSPPPLCSNNTAFKWLTTPMVCGCTTSSNGRQQNYGWTIQLLNLHYTTLRDWTHGASSGASSASF